MSWLARVLGRGRSPDPAQDLACSFCGRHRREVRKLVAGPKVAICDDCVTLCDHILDDETAKAGEASYYVDTLLDAVDLLGPRAAYARARPALRATIELGRRHRPVLRRVMAAASALGDLDTAVAALRAIAPGDRAPGDALDLAGLLTSLGHHDEALVALATLAPPTLDANEAILYTLYDLRIRTERGGLDAAALATVRGRATELAPSIDALPVGPERDGLHNERLAVMTLAALAAGALDGAEHAARARMLARPDSPSAHDHLARVLAARGDDSGARGVRAAGRALAHPESVLAERLRAEPDGRPFR